MKFKSLITLGVFSIACVHASAQTANFEGLSAYVGASNVTSSTKLTSSGVSVEGLGMSSFATDIGADYGIKLGDNSVALVGTTFGLSNPKMYEISGLDDDIDGSTKFKSRWSLYAAPGLTFGPNALLYGKIAYASGKADTAGSKTHTGFGYGAGARFVLTPQIFLNVEFIRQQYDKEIYSGSGISASTTVGTVALGYKF